MSFTDNQGGSPPQKALDMLSRSYDRDRAAPGSRSALDELRARTLAAQKAPEVVSAGEEDGVGNGADRLPGCPSTFGLANAGSPGL